MKKLLSIAFAFIAFMAISQAQIGFRGGVNIAKITAEFEGVSVDYKNTIGFQVGAFYQTALTETIGLRPGLMLSTKGAKLDFLGESATLKTTYLEVPIDFVYNANKLSIHAGPYLGLLMAADSEGEDVKESFKSSDFGLNLGLGYNLTSNIGLGVNYGLGLSNIAEGGDSTDDVSSKNNNISIYLTYTL